MYYGMVTHHRLSILFSLSIVLQCECFEMWMACQTVGTAELAAFLHAQV